MRKSLSEVFPAQREFDSRFEKSQFVAGVVSGAFEHIGIDRLLFEQEPDAVGELNLAAASGPGLFEDCERFPESGCNAR